MGKLQDSEYMRWLEDAVRTVLEEHPKCMALVAKLDGEEVLTAYYNADAEDKAVFAHHIQSDVTMDIIENNIDWIRELLFEESGGTS